MARYNVLRSDGARWEYLTAEPVFVDGDPTTTDDDRIDGDTWSPDHAQAFAFVEADATRWAGMIDGAVPARDHRDEPEAIVLNDPGAAAKARKAHGDQIRSGTPERDRVDRRNRRVVFGGASEVDMAEVQAEQEVAAAAQAAKEAARLEETAALLRS